MQYNTAFISNVQCIEGKIFPILCIKMFLLEGVQSQLLE